MTTPPFILHILVADGDPDGLREANFAHKITELKGLKKAELGGAFRGEL